MQPDQAPAGCACPLNGFVLTTFTPPTRYCKNGMQATRPINCNCPNTHKLVILSPLATCVKIGGGGGGGKCDDGGTGSNEEVERVVIERINLEDIISTV